MIQIKVTRINQQGRAKKIDILVTGHAGYDVKGKDIVCAAVSALTQSLELNLYYDRYITEKPGESHLLIYMNNKTNRILTKAYLHSMQILASQYPDFIEYQENEKQ